MARVLVVDDEAMVRETLRLLAEDLGHDVDVACDGCETFRRCLYLNGAGPAACPL